MALGHCVPTSNWRRGYLWPNPYYQIPEEETARTPSRVSLATGVTASEHSTINPPSPPESLHEVELPVPLPDLPMLPRIDDYNRRVEALWQRVKEHNHQLHQLPISSEQGVEQLLAHIQSGINLDKITFTEGNITYQNLWNLDHNANPQFYTDSSEAVDNNYEQPCLEDIEQQGEEEGEEESPLPIPGPSRTHSRIPQSEHNLDKQSSENTRDRLDRHLGTIIEETFQERTTLEFPPWVNQAHEWVPGVPTAQTLQVDSTERHKQELLNKVADTRTKLLDSYFFLTFIQSFLLFLTYIQFLCTL